MLDDYEVSGLVVVGDGAGLLLSCGDRPGAADGGGRVARGPTRLGDAERSGGESCGGASAAAREGGERGAIVRDGHRPLTGGRCAAVVVHDLFDHREPRLHGGCDIVVRDGARPVFGKGDNSSAVRTERLRVSDDRDFIDAVRTRVQCDRRAALTSGEAGRCRRRASDCDGEIRGAPVATVVVHDMLDDRELRSDVVVCDGARLRIARRNRSAAASGKRRDVGGRAAFDDAVGAGRHRQGRPAFAAGERRERGAVVGHRDREVGCRARSAVVVDHVLDHRERRGRHRDVVVRDGACPGLAHRDGAAATSGEALGVSGLGCLVDAVRAGIERDRRPAFAPREGRIR